MCFLACVHTYFHLLSPAYNLKLDTRYPYLSYDTFSPLEDYFTTICIVHHFKTLLEVLLMAVKAVATGSMKALPCFVQVEWMLLLLCLLPCNLFAEHLGQCPEPICSCAQQAEEGEESCLAQR